MPAQALPIFVYVSTTAQGNEENGSYDQLGSISEANGNTLLGSRNTHLFRQ